MMQTVRWLSLAAGLPLLLGAVACGGANDGKTAKRPTTVESSTNQATKPTAVIEQLSAAEIAKLTAGTPAAADVKASSDCFSAVKSYRYSFELKAPSGGGAGAGPGTGNISFSGAFVAPNRSQMKIDFGGFIEETVMIGDDSWSRAEKGAWVKSDDSYSSTSSFSPNEFCQSALTDVAASGAKAAKEKVGGIDTLRYEFGKEAAGRLSAKLPGGVPDNTKVTLLITEAERLPVKLTMVGDQKSGPNAGSFSLAFNLTDMNKSIAINPPK